MKVEMSERFECEEMGFERMRRGYGERRRKGAFVSACVFHHTIQCPSLKKESRYSLILRRVSVSCGSVMGFLSGSMKSFGSSCGGSQREEI